MKKLIAYLTFLLLTTMASQAAPQYISNFIVKENLTQNGKLAIIAVDSLDNPMERINGTYLFSINGFEQQLAFHDGIAVVKHPLESSTFVFFKHKNQENSVGKLYYIYKSNESLKPIKIYGMLLLIIPALLLLIGYTFKRLLSTIVVLAIIYAYFNYSKGLDLSKVFESAFMALKNFF